MARKKFAIILLVSMLIMMLAGLTLLFFAGSIGMLVSTSFVWPNSFMSDYDQFNMVAGTTSTSCQIGGRVLVIIGGVGLLCSAIAIYFTLPNRTSQHARTKQNEDASEKNGLEAEIEKQGTNNDSTTKAHPKV